MRKRRTRIWVCQAVACVIALAAALAPLSLSSAVAQQVSAAKNQAETDKAPEFRRVFVPAEDPESWPAADGRWLPVGRREFEKLNADAAERRSLHRSGQPRVDSARYTASLKSGDRLVGDAELNISTADSRGRILWLDGWNLPIVKSSWSTTPTDGRAVGLWLKSAGQWSIGAWAAHSDRLRIQWQASPARRSAGGLEFVIRPPAATVARFEIELPSNWAATLTSARQQGQPAQVGDAGLRRWEFQLAPAAEHLLHIRRPIATDDGASFRQAAVNEAYHLEPQGVDYELAVRIDAGGSSDAELRMIVDSGLTITSASLDGTPIAWHEEENSPGAFIVPVGDAGTPHDLRIRASASLELDKLWRLPRVRAEGLRWSEGASTISVSPQLALQSILPHAASLENVLGVGATPARGEAFRIQSWSDQSYVEIVATQPQAAWRAKVATFIELTERETAAESRVQISVDGGTELQTTAEIAPGWTIDRVETTPSAALADWHVAEETAGRRLYIQFRSAPSPAAPVTITIAGRSAAPEDESLLRIQDLAWLKMLGVDAPRTFLAVKDRRGRELVPDFALASSIQTPDMLDAGDLAFLGDVAGNLIIEAGNAPRDAAIRAESRPAQFEGEAQVELIAAAGAFRHHVDVTLRPTQGVVGQFTLKLARPLPSDAAWKLAETNEALAVEKLPEASDANADASGAAYRVRLPRPADKPTALAIDWTTPQRATERVNNVTAPEAESWQAWAVLRGDPQRFHADDGGAEPAAAAPLVADQSSQVLGCFHLPAEASDNAVPAIKLVANGAAQSLAATPFCWFADEATRQYADGRALHRLRYDLELRGAPWLDFAVPESWSPARVEVDGAEAALENIKGEPTVRRLRLPTDRQFATAVVEYHSRREPLGVTASAAPPTVRPKAPVFRGRWILWTPPEYVTDQTTGAQANVTPMQRLFGPLARGGRRSEAPTLLTSLEANGGAASATVRKMAFHRGGAELHEGSEFLVAGLHPWIQDYSSAPRAVRLWSTASVEAAWACVVSSAIVLAIFIGKRRQKWLLLAAGAAAVAALVAPSSIVWLPQALFLGLACGTTIRAIFSGLADFAATGSLAGAAKATAWCGVLAAATAATRANGELPVAPATQRELPAVLLPVDNAGQPAGDDVYLGESLYDRLWSAARGEPFEGSPITILDASYKLRFSGPDKVATAPVVCELTFQVQTRRDRVSVYLPLTRHDGRWLTDRFRIDGAPARYSWNEAGAGCKFEFAAAGIHEVQLAVEPRILPENGRAQVRIHVPELPGAQVEVANLDAVEDFVLGSTATPLSSATNNAELAAALAGKVLAASWRAASPLASGDIAAQQETHLRIDPAAARVEVRWELSGVGGPVETLELECASPLRLAAFGAESLVQRADLLPGAMTTYRLALRRPMSLPFVISLPLELQRSVSIGRIEMPQAKLRGVSLRRHEFTVMVDPRLTYRDEVIGGLRAIGGGDAQSEVEGPNIHYLVSADNPQWFIDVAPRAAEFVARESLDVLCQTNRLYADYTAYVDKVAGEILVHRLAVDPRLEITDVAVQQESLATPVRWSRPNADELVVFLGQPMRGAHELNIRGVRRFDAAGSAFVPKIELVGGDQQTEVIVRRSAEALATVVGAVPDKSNDAQTEDPARGVVLRCTFLRGQKPIELRIEPNQPQFTVDAAIWMNASSAAAEATLILHGEVTRGVVDHVRVYAPKTWQGPLRTTPISTTSIRGSIYDARRQVVELRLAKPVAAGSQFTLSVAGSLHGEPGQAPAVPNIRVINAARQRTWIVLPPPPADQSVEWALSGVQPEPLPAELASQAKLPVGAQSFAAARRDFSAQQRVFPRALRNSAVRSAKISAAIDMQGDMVATAILVVQPGAHERFEILMPPDAKLLYAKQDGQPTDIGDNQARKWLAPAGAPFLPRTICLAYRQPAQVTGGAYVFLAPQVKVAGHAIKLKNCIWSVEAPGGATWASPSELDPDEASTLIRRESLAAVADAAPLALRLAPWELRNWLVMFRSEHSLERATTEAMGGATADESTADGVSTPAKAWQRLWQAADPHQERSSAIKGDVVSNSAPRFGAPSGSGQITILRGDEDGSAAAAVAPRDPTVPVRWLTALAIAAMLAAVIHFRRELAPLAEALGRRPHAMAFALGLFWWLALNPPGLGAAFALLAAADWVRQALSGARNRRLTSGPAAAPSN